MNKATTSPAAIPTPNNDQKTCPYCGTLFSPMQVHECDYFERWLPTILETKVQPYNKNNKNNNNNNSNNNNNNTNNNNNNNNTNNNNTNNNNNNNTNNSNNNNNNTFSASSSSASSVDFIYLPATARACRARRESVISSVYDRIRSSMQRLANTLKKGEQTPSTSTTGTSISAAVTVLTCPYCKNRYCTDRVHHCPSGTVGCRHCPERFTERRQLAMHLSARHRNQIEAAEKEVKKKKKQKKVEDKTSPPPSCRCPLCPRAEPGNRFTSVEALQRHFARHEDFRRLVRCAGCRQGVDAPVFTKLLSLYRHVKHSHTTEEWCAGQILLDSIVESGGSLELKLKKEEEEVVVMKKDARVQQPPPTKSAPHPKKKKTALTTSIEQVIDDDIDEEKKDENKDGDDEEEEEDSDTVTTSESDSTVVQSTYQPTSTTSNRFKCSLCVARFPTLRALTAHFSACHQKRATTEKILSPEKNPYRPYRCPVCPHTAGRAQSLKVHFASKHATLIFGVSCAQCPKASQQQKSFGGLLALYEHVVKSHRSLSWAEVTECLKASIEGAKKIEIKEEKEEEEEVIETNNELFEEDEEAESSSRTAVESIIENEELFTTTTTTATSTSIISAEMSLGDSSSQLCPLVPSSVIPYQQQQLIDTNNNNNNNENGLSYTEVAPAAVSYQQLQEQQTGAIVTPTFYTLPSSAPAAPGIVPANYQHPNFQSPYQPPYQPLSPAGIPYYPNPYYPTPYQPGYPGQYFPANYYQPPPPQLPMQQPPTQPLQLTINNYGVINMQR